MNNDEDYVFPDNAMWGRLTEATGFKSIERLVIDIQWHNFVKVFVVAGDSAKVLKAINLEDLIKGAKITELGLDKPEEATE